MSPAGPASQPPEPGAPTAPSDPVHLRVRGIHKTFGPQKVLRGIDLDIERGKINIIIGGSGSGKSVLMKHLMGLLKPDRGEIVVDGTDIVPMNDVELGKMRRRFGMVFQHAALFDSLNVIENIAFPLIERYHLPKSEIEGRVRELLRALDLARIAGVEQKFPAQLSGGQQKRVGLARALIDRPQILLYDEPTTGLDPIQTKNVDEMIKTTSEKFGVTSVVISHDMASTFRIGDRISMLYEGVIRCTGTPDQIRSMRDPVVRDFVEVSGAVAFDQGGGAQA